MGDNPNPTQPQPTQPTQQTPDTEHRRRFEGQLNKFTNVVKGWQYRWFVLDPESGRLEYYLLEDRNGKCRGSQHLSGAVVIPSEEDGQTFTVNLASGEMFKMRASHAKERQMWVDRLRACAHMHNQALASNHPVVNMREYLPPTPPGARSHISTGEPSDQLQNLSLTALDAFGSVHDILHKVDEKHQSLAKTIESLPLGKDVSTEDLVNHLDVKQPLEATCHNEQLLLIKATSQATLMCMESALAMLQEIRENQLFAPVQKTFAQTAVNLIPASPSKGHLPLTAADTSGTVSSTRPKSADTRVKTGSA